MNRAILVVLPLTATLSLWSCSSSTPKESSASAPSKAAKPPLTPTPGILSRIDPNVVEETETYVVHRLPKSEYLRVDDRHIRHPLIKNPVEFFKEDEKYYYIQTPRWLPEEVAQRQTAAKEPSEKPATPSEVSPSGQAPPLSDFEDLLPPRSARRLTWQRVQASGLPTGGMWRASFVLADFNGDGFLDIVAPAPRVGDATLHIWLGNGKGTFSEWPLTFSEEGQPSTNFSIDYGGVAVGDIDGDGKLDVVTASHGFGLVSLFGDGRGGFRVVRAGLPQKEFSSQAIILLDVDGDGHLDIVASQDVLDQDRPSDPSQVRVYLYRGAKGWQLKADAIIGGVISNSLRAWDYDGDGKQDLLTGSHQFGALALLWKNQGNGTFVATTFPGIEAYAYHFATTPGTFGAGHAPAFADAFHLFTNTPKIARATGITIYSFEDSAWHPHRVWRKRGGESSQFALAMGDLDGDGLDDVVFADTQERRLRVFFQRRDGSFEEMSERDEPTLDSPGQCIRIGDLDKDGRPDVVLAKTVSSNKPDDPGGWDVFLNKAATR